MQFSGLHAHGLDQVQRGDAGRAGAVQHQLDVRQLAAGDLAGVDQAGGRDDRGAVLVVVEHRDVEQLLQLGLDAEALGALDVLQIDAAEGDADVLDHGDDLVGVARDDLDVDGVDVGEALEQHRLAFHHRLGGQRAQVAQAQDGGAVGDHRHQVALGGVVVGERPDPRRSPAPARPRPANRPATGRAGSPSAWSATTAILPGVGSLWNASASSSVKVRFSASLMRFGLLGSDRPAWAGNRNGAATLAATAVATTAARATACRAGRARIDRAPARARHCAARRSQAPGTGTIEAMAQTPAAQDRHRRRAGPHGPGRSPRRWTAGADACRGAPCSTGRDGGPAAGGRPDARRAGGRWRGCDVIIDFTTAGGLGGAGRGRARRAAARRW